MHPAVTAGGVGRVSDEALAARVRCDPEVFTEVYDRYFRAIYLYVAARLGAGPAEDIAAETFAVALGQRHRFDPARGGLLSLASVMGPGGCRKEGTAFGHE